MRLITSVAIFALASLGCGTSNAESAPSVASDKVSWQSTIAETHELLPGLTSDTTLENEAHMCRDEQAGGRTCLSFFNGRLYAKRAVTLGIAATDALSAYTSQRDMLTKRHGDPETAHIFRSPAKSCLVVVHPDGRFLRYSDSDATDADHAQALAAAEEGLLCADADFPGPHRLILSPAGDAYEMTLTQLNPDAGIHTALRKNRMRVMKAMQQRLNEIQDELDN